LAALGALVVGGCAAVPLSQGLPDGSDYLRATMAAQGDIGIEAPTSDLRQLDLASGLRVGFERAPTRGMVGVVLVVGGGSTGDPHGKEGLAHLVEHLTFHARFDKRPASETLARLAATYNADTALDRTRFYEFAPRASLPALLRLVAQRLARPLEGVTEDDVAVEREIVQNELRQRNETLVYGEIGDWTQRALFPREHPYSRPIGGTLASLRTLSLDDARTLARATYAPQNATLLIVGDFDLDAAVASIARDFPAALRGDKAAPRTHEVASRIEPPAYLPPPPPQGYDELKVGVAWPEIWLSYFLADMYGAYAPSMKVLTAPIVVKTLRDILTKEDDVVDVELETSEFRHATVLSCRIKLLSDRHRREIAERARWLIASLWSGQSATVASNPWAPVDYALLAKAEKLALADAIFAGEPYTTRAVNRAEYFHMTGAVNAYDGLTAAVAALPLRAVASHGAYLLAASRARVLFVEPLPEDQRAAPGVVGVPTINNRNDANGMAMGPSTGADFGDPPTTPPAPELQHARRFQLANGMQVVLVQRLQFPSIAAVLGFGGGAAASPPGVVELLRLLEREGTFALDQNALEITKADTEGDAADLVVAGRRNLSNALFMLSLRLRVIDELQWKGLIASVRSSDAVKESPTKRATRAFWHALYGAHGYGRVIGADDLRKLDSGEVKGWLPHLYNPANATLVVAGDFDLPTAESLVSRWFGPWTGTRGVGALDVARVSVPAAGPPHETVIVTHRPGSTQVEVTLGCRLPSRGDPHSLATARMLADVVVGDLNLRLREEAGAAYTVGGSAEVLPGGGAHLVVSAAIDNLRFREALRVLRGHWEAYGHGAFDRGTLSQVRWDWARATGLGFQTSTDVALQTLNASNLGWAPADLAALPAATLAVTAADLRRAFAVCRSSTVLSLLGDEPTIHAALDAASDASKD
jgi:zinc protease